MSEHALLLERICLIHDSSRNGSSSYASFCQPITFGSPKSVRKVFKSSGNTLMLPDLVWRWLFKWRKNWTAKFYCELLGLQLHDVFIFSLYMQTRFLIYCKSEPDFDSSCWPSWFYSYWVSSSRQQSNRLRTKTLSIFAILLVNSSRFWESSNSLIPWISPCCLMTPWPL